MFLVQFKRLTSALLSRSVYCDFFPNFCHYSSKKPLFLLLPFQIPFFGRAGRLQCLQQMEGLPLNMWLLVCWIFRSFLPLFSRAFLSAQKISPLRAFFFFPPETSQPYFRQFPAVKFSLQVDVPRLLLSPPTRTAQPQNRANLLLL